MIATLRGWLAANPALAWAIAFQAGLALFALVAMVFDRRVILGLNPWVKPLKFDLSVAILLVTMAAILSGVEGGERTRIWIGAGLGIALSLENCIISLQSLRGVQSHMNYSTPLNARLFACMGVLFIVATVLIVWTFALTLAGPTVWAPALAWGVRLGLIVLLAGCAEGIVIVGRGQHTVGATDGLEGLPFINWSERHGDLRVAHFFALHALQAFPALGWLLSRTALPVWLQLTGTGLGAAVYIGFVWFLFQQAMAGRPLLGI